MAELALLNDPVCCCILMTCAKIVHSGGDNFRVRCSMDVERRGAMPKVLHRCRIYYECVRCYYFHIHKLACSVVVDCSFSRFPNEASPYIVVPIYLPAAPTSAKFLTCFSSVVVSNRQKQSVSDAFQNVVLPPSSAPTSFEVARRELAVAKLGKENEIRKGICNYFYRKYRYPLLTGSFTGCKLGGSYISPPLLCHHKSR